ncbi:hypothetical protein DY000_02028058 [Brassica cretica]|uniref:RanBD1 domain-containing protein n=2 Tax=Brassica cretica TaxID=69181 RepID=A0ABQ7EAE6_BRACR|nr:hypothetical protein DY000_02028058 [Brassica cretica]
MNEWRFLTNIVVWGSQNEIKSDTDRHREHIHFLISKVDAATFTDISEVETFVKWIDDELSSLVDERAVLKHFPKWPERKADSLREAACIYRALKSLETEILSFKENPKEPLKQHREDKREHREEIQGFSDTVGVDARRRIDRTGSHFTMATNEPEHEPRDVEEAGANEDEDTGAQVAPIVRLEEVAVTTGEEDEDAVLDLKSKLYRFDKEANQWKERGAGTVKLLKHKSTGKIRLVMRQSKTLKICANHFGHECLGNEKSRCAVFLTITRKRLTSCSCSPSPSSSLILVAPLLPYISADVRNCISLGWLSSLLASLVALPFTMLTTPGLDNVFVRVYAMCAELVSWSFGPFYPELCVSSLAWTSIPVMVGTKFDEFIQLPIDLQWTIASQARTYAKALNATLFFSSASYNINVNKIFKFVTAKLFDLPWTVERNLTIGEPLIDF